MPLSCGPLVEIFKVHLRAGSAGKAGMDVEVCDERHKGTGLSRAGRGGIIYSRLSEPSAAVLSASGIPRQSGQYATALPQ